MVVKLCEHGDHPDYKFPVDVYFGGKRPEVIPEDEFYINEEQHAFIYTDGNIAVTMNECCYYMWRLSDGSCLFNPFQKEWILKEESLKKIKEYVMNKNV